MSITSKLPGITLSARPGNVEALGLRPLQPVTAIVLGPGGNGATQLQIGRHMLSLMLPSPLPPGTAVTLEVEGHGAEQRLVLTPQAPPAAAAQPVPAPAVITASSQPVVMPIEAIRALNLKPEQLVPAQVMGPPVNGATPMQIGNRTVPVVLPTPLPPGTTVILQAQGQGAEQRLVIVPQPQTATQPTVPPPPAQALPDAHNTAVRAALTQMLQTAVAHQDSMAPLTTALTDIAGKVPLPAPVVRAAEALLATRLQLAAPALTGADMQKAVLSSGVFQEAMLAAGMSPRANADVKTALLTLRQALANWLGPAPAAPNPPPGRPPPPVRGTAPRLASAPPMPMDLDQPVEAVGRVLLDRTEAALSRLRLHQHASLPDATPSAQPAVRSEWLLEVPVMIGTYQTMMQLQIHRDGHKGAEHAAERGWQMRFAIDLPVMGEVGAQVNLRAGVTSVLLWAAEPETAALLDAELPELSRALIEAGLKPSAIHCRQGEPPASPVASGHFMDMRT